MILTNVGMLRWKKKRKHIRPDMLRAFRTKRVEEKKTPAFPPALPFVAVGQADIQQSQEIIDLTLLKGVT